MSDAPKRLYLQTHDNPNDEFAWTHADHRIHDDDTEYVRAEEIERLEAKVKSLEWARDQAVQAWEVNTEENDRLRAALEEIRDGATTYDPADYGWQRTGGSFADCQWCDHWSERGVVKHYEHCPARIAREALNDD